MKEEENQGDSKMSDKKSNLKKSILSYFESRKTGQQDVPDISPTKLKPSKQKKLPNKIEPIIKDTKSDDNEKISSEMKNSFDGLIKKLNDISGSSVTTNKNIINNYYNKNYSSETHVPKSIFRTKNEVSNTINKSLTNSFSNKSVREPQKVKGSSLKSIPKIINFSSTDESKKIINNSIHSDEMKKNIENINNSITNKFTKINKPQREYKTTSANKKIPKIIELTKLNNQTKNVFTNLANKVYSVTPNKTSSKILSSLVNYENTKNNNSKNSKTVNLSPKNIQNNIHNSVEKMYSSQMVGKEKYNIIEVPSLANEGMVDSPTLAMVGDSVDPEVVSRVPRTKPAPDLTINQTKEPTPSSVAIDSVNTNTILRMERENAELKEMQKDKKDPPLMINSSIINEGGGGPQMNFAPTRSMMGIQNETSLPKWRKNIG